MLLTLAVGVEGFALIFAMRRQRACVRRQATVDQPGRLAPSPLADASPARRACTKVCWCNRRPQESQGAANGGRKCGRASAPRRLGHAGPHLPTFLSAPAQARTPRPAQQSSTEYLQVEGMDDEPSFMSSHVVPLLCRCDTLWERAGGGGLFFFTREARNPAHFKAPHTPRNPLLPNAKSHRPRAVPHLCVVVLCAAPGGAAAAPSAGVLPAPAYPSLLRIFTNARHALSRPPSPFPAPRRRQRLGEASRTVGSACAALPPPPVGGACPFF